MLFPCKMHGEWNSEVATACPDCMAEARSLLVRCFLELQEYDGHLELKQDIRQALGDAACNKCGTNGEHYCPADVDIDSDRDRLDGHYFND